MQRLKKNSLVFIYWRKFRKVFCSNYCVRLGTLFRCFLKLTIILNSRNIPERAAAAPQQQPELCQPTNLSIGLLFPVPSQHAASLLGLQANPSAAVTTTTLLPNDQPQQQQQQQSLQAAAVKPGDQSGEAHRRADQHGPAATTARDQAGCAWLRLCSTRDQSLHGWHGRVHDSASGAACGRAGPGVQGGSARQRSHHARQRPGSLRQNASRAH